MLTTSAAMSGDDGDGDADDGMQPFGLKVFGRTPACAAQRAMLRALFAAAPHLEGLTSLHKCCNGGDLAGQAIEYDGVCEFSEHGDAGSVATPACLCGLPAESPGEKLSQEKSRLRDMARDFFKRAEWGIPLKLVDPETRALVQCLFRVDPRARRGVSSGSCCRRSILGLLNCTCLLRISCSSFSAFARILLAFANSVACARRFASHDASWPSIPHDAR